MGSIASSKEIEREREKREREREREKKTKKKQKKTSQPQPCIYLQRKFYLERQSKQPYTSTKNLFYREKRSENKL